MTKKTCTPRRKALARRFKHGDLHNESALQIVDQLLEYELVGNSGNMGTYDPEKLQNTIRDLMQRQGLGYEEARDQAMQQHDPNRPQSKPSTGHRPLTMAGGDRPLDRVAPRCTRCGSKLHSTENCHMAGVPLV